MSKWWATVPNGEEDIGEYMGEAQVFGEYTGDTLPPEFVAKAQAEAAPVNGALGRMGGHPRGGGVAADGEEAPERAMGRLQQRMSRSV